MNKFIYVFNIEAHNRLIRMGYVLFQADYKNSMYVFLNDPNKDIDKADVSYFLSDTATF